MSAPVETKLLDIRDDGTRIPVLAIRIDPREAYEGDWDVLNRAAIRSDKVLLLTKLSHYEQHDEPHQWAQTGGRTMKVAHQHMIDHWDELVSGQVVDVEFILGETAWPKGMARPATGTTPL